MTKEMWISLSEKDKKKEVRGWLQQLADIEHGRHPFKGKPEEGNLPKVRKDLEELVLKTLEWEKTK